MKKYQYPSEVTEGNFGELVERAKDIVFKSSVTHVVSIIVSILLMIIILVAYLLPIPRMAQNAVDFAWISLAMATGLALFVVGFLMGFVEKFLRRLYNAIIPYYPSSEEFVFAQLILTANVFDKEKSQRARYLHFRSMRLSEEFSTFNKFDIFNFKRKFYREEFTLLASGQTQIGRMLLFSEKKKKELLSKFALALINDEDRKAHLLLKVIIEEVKKYGELEGLTKRILNKLTKWQTIVTLIGGLLVIVTKIIDVFVT